MPLNPHNSTVRCPYCNTLTKSIANEHGQFSYQCS